MNYRHHTVAVALGAVWGCATYNAVLAAWLYSEWILAFPLAAFFSLAIHDVAEWLSSPRGRYPAIDEWHRSNRKTAWLCRILLVAVFAYIIYFERNTKSWAPVATETISPFAILAASIGGVLYGASAAYGKVRHARRLISNHEREKASPSLG